MDFFLLWPHYHPPSVVPQPQQPERERETEEGMRGQLFGCGRKEEMKIELWMFGDYFATSLLRVLLVQVPTGEWWCLTAAGCVLITSVLCSSSGHFLHPQLDTQWKSQRFESDKKRLNIIFEKTMISGRDQKCPQKKNKSTDPKLWGSPGRCAGI